mmetsp:Transcript_125354/g.348808  ORF Transcript_125354/g.348808 Transcript_125354/m.348808 type:complete len:210 (+) Transcript_125354:736-1365(+)
MAIFLGLHVHGRIPPVLNRRVNIVCVPGIGGCLLKSLVYLVRAPCPCIRNCLLVKDGDSALRKIHSLIERRLCWVLGDFTGQIPLIVSICTHPIHSIWTELPVLTMLLQALKKVMHGLSPPVAHKEAWLLSFFRQQLNIAALSSFCCRLDEILVCIVQSHSDRNKVVACSISPLLQCTACFDLTVHLAQLLECDASHLRRSTFYPGCSI